MIFASSCGHPITCPFCQIHAGNFIFIYFYIALQKSRAHSDNVASIRVYVLALGRFNVILAFFFLGPNEHNLCPYNEPTVGCGIV